MNWRATTSPLLASAEEIPYEETPDNVAKQKRLIEHVRTLYRPDDLGLVAKRSLDVTAVGRAGIFGDPRGELQAGTDSRVDYQNVWRQGHRPDARRRRPVCAQRRGHELVGTLQGAAFFSPGTDDESGRGTTLTPEITFFCRGGYVIRFIARISKPKASLITMPTICSSSKPGRPGQSSNSTK